MGIWQHHGETESGTSDLQALLDMCGLKKGGELVGVTFDATRRATLMQLRADRLASKTGGAYEAGLVEDDEEPLGKPDYMELAKIYGLTMARLEWLHEQFQNFFPEGVVDNYPDEPAGLYYR